MDASLPFRGETWAFVVGDPAELARLPLGATRPPAAPWYRVLARPASPDSPTPTWTLLLAADGSPWRGAGLEPERVVCGDEASIAVRGERCTIIEVSLCGSLLEAVPLVSASAEALPSVVIVRLHDAREAAAAVHAMLLLNRRGLALAHVTDSSDETYLLLRVESPSPFVLEHWVDAGRAVYRPGPGGLWVALGSRHPWESVWTATPRDDDEVVLVESGRWMHLSGAAFEDALDSVVLELPAHVERWEPVARPVRLTVPMRWGETARPASAELWLLGGDELFRLERLFGLLSLSDLENLQLASVRAPDGVDWFLVREALSGQSRQFLDFGEAFGAVPGVPKLFVPVLRHLEPPVPRHMLERLFELADDTLTLVRPVGSGREQSMRVVRVAESAFRSVGSLMDHVVRGASEVLAAILERTVIDLGPLADLPERPSAPPRPELALRLPGDAESAAAAAPTPVETEDDVSTADPEAVGADAPDAGDDVDTPDGDDAAVDALPEVEPDEGVTEPEPQEAAVDAAEQAAVQALDDRGTWLALARLKRDAGALEEAIACFEHALWVGGDPGRDPARSELAGVLDALGPEATPAMRLRAQVLHFQIRRPEETLHGFGERFAGLVSALRDGELTLPKKARWLCWQHVLSIGPDPIEAARVSESLLRELSLHGVEERDSFAFVRRHVRMGFEDRGLPSGLDALLRGMQSQAAEIERIELRVEAEGAVATARDAIGDREAIDRLLAASTLQPLLAQPRDVGGRALATCAAAAARAGRPEAHELFDAALRRLDAMSEGLQKDRTLVHILEQLQLSTLLGSEEALVERALAAIGRQRPLRQCIQLFDGAELLRDLGGAAAGGELALSLLVHPEVRADAYYLSHALSALVTFQAGRPPDGQTASGVLEVLLPQTPFDDAVARAVDMALGGCESSVLARLRAELRRTNATDSLMLESCLVRGHALFGEVDAGLALLSARLDSVWRLGDGPGITQALRRLVPSAAHLGRPEQGIALVEGVVQRLGEGGIQGLGDRERGEILEVCARTAGRLGAQERAFGLLTRIVDSFETLVAGPSRGMSFLFEILGLVVEQVIATGEVERGADLVDRAVRTIDQRMQTTLGTDHPYFMHEARIKCAIALLSLDRRDRGLALVARAARDIAAVRVFDGRDRVDLCREAIRALTLVPLEDADRIELLELLVRTGIGSERQGTFSDGYRRDLIVHTVRELLQRQSAYRLALTKVRAHEERLIRDRVLRMPLHEGEEA